MRFQVRSAILLLPLLLTACSHKTQQAQNQVPLAPPIEDTPPPAPDNAPANLPPPVITVPKPTVVPAPQPAPPPKPAPKAPTKKSHKSSSNSSKPAPSNPAPAQNQNTEQAANNPPEVSAAGQFSSGAQPDLRQDTTTTINETERSLNGITRKLSDQEEKTSAQIREFLKQAKTALQTGDIDGAHTLALKAKVLLSELNQ